MTAAIAALQRKKDHQQALEQNEKTMRTLEQQINAIESANITATTFKSLKEAADVLTKIQKDITPDKVDQVKYAPPHPKLSRDFAPCLTCML